MRLWNQLKVSAVFDHWLSYAEMSLQVGYHFSCLMHTLKGTDERSLTHSLLLSHYSTDQQMVAHINTQSVTRGISEEVECKLSNVGLNTAWFIIFYFIFYEEGN